MFDFLSEKFSGILGWVKNKGRLTEENIDEAFDQVRTALLEADVPYTVVEQFLADVKDDVVGQKISSKVSPGQQLIKIVHDRVLAFLGGTNVVPFSFQIPSVIMMMGLQGSGKTTTIAKIAQHIIKDARKRNKMRKILCGSVDFYRPAAVDQLEVLARQVGIDFYRASSTDPVKAAKEIYREFKQGGYAHLFLDTAGRLHVDNDMLEEIRAIDTAVDPKYKLLVLDAMTGQESINVAQAFAQSVGFDAGVLTKMDSDARGGAAFTFRYALGKPVAFVGVGEKIDDLESFVPERITTRMLGMGDILTLIEKAEEHVDQESQEQMTKRFMSGQFTLEDFAQQLDMVSKMGSLQRLMKFMPGAGNVSPEQVEAGQKESGVFRAILHSMTKKERLMPHILNGSRKERIARGSGTAVAEVNKLLERFEQSKHFAKMLKKAGPLKRFFK